MPARSILLVDDNAEVRESVGDLLRAHGHAVTMVASGEEALLWAAGRSPDVLVTDLDMPGMDGLRLLDRLRQRWPQLPVLVVTSRSDDAELVRRAAAGQLELLGKPFAGEELVRRLADGVSAPSADSGVAPPLGPNAPVAARNAPAQEEAAVPSTARRALAWLAVAALVIVLGGLVALLWHRPPPLPAPPEHREAVRRGAQIEIVEPRGDVAGPPVRLAWQPVPRAARYVAELRAVDDAVLWEGESDGASVELAGVADRLEPGVVYFVRVRALDGSGQVIAASERVRFQLEPAATPAARRPT